MGIPSYFSHIVRKYRTIFKKYDKTTHPIDNLYLDCNSIIYEAVNDLQKENKIPSTSPHFEPALINAVCKKLSYYIHLISPKNRVYVAFDGVAPVAKLDQQRKRRYMTWYNNKMITDIRNENIRNEHSSKPSSSNTTSTSTTCTWNTSAITPGTPFMELLGKEIKQQFIGNENIEVICSCSDEVGEGEHKIYEYIRTNAEYHQNTTTVIYGLDADLIMLTLNHLHISDKMYLFRETPNFIQQVDKTLDPNELYLMDIPTFAFSMIAELTDSTTKNDNSDPHPSLKSNKIFDYIFMCFMLGNDFMPHFPALNIRTNGIEKLICAYKHVFKGSDQTLISNDAKGNQYILWKNLRKFIDYLSQNELDYLKEEYKRRDKQEKNMSYYNNSTDATKEKKAEEDLLMIPLKERSIEKYINPYESGWQERYYTALFNIRINDDRRKEICLNYLEGLEWTMKYYSSGCIDWRWTYKYDYPPLLCDLIKYVPYFDTCLLDVKPKLPVKSLVQLVYVLPRSSHALLPNKVLPLLKQEWYKEDCDFRWSFCKFFWESHVCLPEINITEIEKIIK